MRLVGFRKSKCNPRSNRSDFLFHFLLINKVFSFNNRRVDMGKRVLNNKNNLIGKFLNILRMKEIEI